MVPIVLSQGLIRKDPAIVVSERELQCLTDNMYHEARGESVIGQIAVAQVTLNRVKHDSQFKSTICGVVYQKNQFSWTLNRQLRVKDYETYKITKALARSILAGYYRIPEFNALYYHTTQVNPKWNRNKYIITRIGSHIFYA